MKNKFGQYYKRKTIKRALRLAVYERDDFTCQYCGLHGDEGELQIDHIIPVSRGGTNDINNLVTSCATCNKKKGAKLSHVHPNTIRRWELSERTPNSAKLNDLSQALGVSVVELMSEEDTPAIVNDTETLPIKKVPTSSSRSSKWMLVYERDGERIELPPTEQGYNIINRIAEAMVKRPAMVTQTAVMA